MRTNDITGDRLVSKIDRENIKKFEENMEKIFGKKKETNGGWKYEPANNDSGSVINSNDKVDK